MLFSKAYQQLWLLVVTTFIESSHVLPIPLTLAPIRLVLAESSSPHGFNGNVMLRVHCQQALLLLRVLPMEQQVRVFFLLSLEQSLRMLQVATARRHDDRVAGILNVHQPDSSAVKIVQFNSSLCQLHMAALKMSTHPRRQPDLHHTTRPTPVENRFRGVGRVRVAPGDTLTALRAHNVYQHGMQREQRHVSNAQPPSSGLR
jgi:hypothetical protein